MATDFTRYQVPGVYVDEMPSVAPVFGAVTEVSVAIIGWSMGKRKFIEQVTLAGTAASELTAEGALAGAVVTDRDTGIQFIKDLDYTEAISEGKMSIARIETPVVDEAIELSGTYGEQLAHPRYVVPTTVVVASEEEGGGTVYTENTDYVVDYNNGTIARLPGSRIADGATVYVSYSYCAIKTGAAVIVEYDYVPDGYYSPQAFYSIDDVYVMYGEPFDAEGVLQSQLSLGAYFAYLNGASRVICVAVENDADATNIDYINALEKIAAEDDIDIIVPLTNDAVVMQACDMHVRSCSRNGLERRAFLGGNGETIAQLRSLADAMSNERIVLISPSEFLFSNILTGKTETIAGYYVAAALAGVASSIAPNQSLTRKSIAGGFSLISKRSIGDMSSDARSGVCAIMQQGSVLKVFHGVTTDVSTVTTAEYSVVFCKDRIRQMLRQSFASLIGEPILEDTVYIVKSLASAALEMARDAGLIVSYRDLMARQHPSLPTLIEIKFAYQPVYPANYISILFSLDVSSGQITIE